MGIVSSPLVDSLDLKGKYRECSLWSKVLEAQAKRKSPWQVIRKRRVTWKNGNNNCKKPRRVVLMKKRAALRSSEAASRRPAANVVERKVRTLKKLVPISGESNIGLDGIFRETADYILALQMRVQVMRIMVHVLTVTQK